MSMRLKNTLFRLNFNAHFQIAEFNLKANDYLVIVGQNGSGKSAIAAALAGKLDCLQGEAIISFKHIELVSFELLQKQLNKQWHADNTDNLTEDEIGKTVKEFLLEDSKLDEHTCQYYIKEFEINYLLKRPFRLLSTGEMRKVYLCQKIFKSPDLLILDEPFDGLDIHAKSKTKALLKTLHKNGTTLILVLNRFSDIPEEAQSLGIVSQLSLIALDEKSRLMKQIEVEQLVALESISTEKLPPAPVSAVTFPTDKAKVILNAGNVSYDGNAIIKNLTWHVEPNEHWHILGANGVGKSTLLSLITGDHPQGYANDLTLFGIKRGSGETIWDIKKYIGYVSSSLHQAYRVKTSVENVIISGFYDSIGLYETPSEEVKSLTKSWFEFLNWDLEIRKSPFHALSWGQQRLILIIRAMVKHPALLILDEPFQGLDALNREWVKAWISKLVVNSRTQLLFVSHHPEDAPSAITHRLTLFKNKNACIEKLI